jgi:hypothetical protein
VYPKPNIQIRCTANIMDNTKRRIVATASAILVTTIIIVVGIFYMKTTDVLAYTNKDLSDGGENDYGGALINEAPIINNDVGILCIQPDSNASCAAHHEGTGNSGNSSISVAVPVKVNVPINNTNINTNNITGRISSSANPTNNNNITGRISSSANPTNNNITIAVPPVGTRSIQAIPGLGILAARTTLPDSEGNCLKTQFHATSNAVPACVSLLIKR